MNLQGRWTPGDLARALKAALSTEPREAMAAYVRELMSHGDEWQALERFTVQDYRDHPRPKGLKRGRSKGIRAWSDITGICLHQTASPVGHDHPRLLGVPAHSHVSQEGVITLLQPATAYMWHGHALNRFTIGIEVEARADGIEGDPSTFWRSPRERNGYRNWRGKWVPPKSRDQLRSEATDKQLRALDALIRYYIRLHRRNASPPVQPLGLYAHRQGHKSRVSDPGSRIAGFVYRNLVDEGFRFRHYLVDTTGETYGGGRPWPQEWKR